MTDKEREAHKLYMREWRKNNIEKVRAYQAKWGRENRDKTRDYQRTYQAIWKRKNRECLLARRRELFKINIDEVNALNRKWRHTNKERARLRDRIWYAKNKAERIARWHRYRCQKSSTDDGSVTKQVISNFIETTLECPYCGRLLTDKNRCLDHKEPLVLGGTHTVGNILICCRSCNTSKGSKPYHVWLGLIKQKAAR
jgi:5-methylcytosine-specific restriction endonuclease McrA